MTATRLILWSLFFLVVLLFYPLAHADKLTWTHPTARGNDTPFNAATEQSANKIYKNTVVVATVQGALTSWDSGSTSCTPVNWAVTSLDKTLPPVGPLESPLSVSVLGPIDVVGCAPKAPGNVKAGL